MKGTSEVERLEARGWKLAAGSWRLEARGWRLEAEERKAGGGGRKMEVGKTRRNARADRWQKRHPKACCGASDCSLRNTILGIIILDDSVKHVGRPAWTAGGRARPPLNEKRAGGDWAD